MSYIIGQRLPPDSYGDLLRFDGLLTNRPNLINITLAELICLKNKRIRVGCGVLDFLLSTRDQRSNNNKDNYDRLKNAFNKGIRVGLW
jgi:hypothetical protein